MTQPHRGSMPYASPIISQASFQVFEPSSFHPSPPITISSPRGLKGRKRIYASPVMDLVITTSPPPPIPNLSTPIRRATSYSVPRVEEVMPTPSTQYSPFDPYSVSKLLYPPRKSPVSSNIRAPRNQSPSHSTHSSSASGLSTFSLHSPSSSPSHFYSDPFDSFSSPHTPTSLFRHKEQFRSPQFDLCPSSAEFQFDVIFPEAPVLGPLSRNTASEIMSLAPSDPFGSNDTSSFFSGLHRPPSQNPLSAVTRVMSPTSSSWSVPSKPVFFKDPLQTEQLKDSLPPSSRPTGTEFPSLSDHAQTQNGETFLGNAPEVE
ncbi:hypothetical protein BLNAU_14109 [Blattamonas nauphoetae]|uniref:Uncharacterized protein n=1 Tax=Blattamonas nauphoetae TaxID=2049346 RepID=A0ABQ9XJC4_9EUKA|nr:hypothetical protein BLNAU_14109 [Blattamonas nauphoetae]